MPEFDFRATRAKGFSYMIATIPRSGSTYFAIQMWRTGLLGAPMEYLNLTAMSEHIMLRLGVKNPGRRKIDIEEVRKYWTEIKRIRTSPNGVFGYKMFMIVFHELIQAYPDIFEEVQPDYVVYLTRQDLVGQAISYSRAKQTKTWFADVPNAPAASYNFQHILQCKREIDAQCRYWEGVFAQAQIRPIRVTYEELLESEESTMARVLGQMGIVADNARRLEIPQIRRQADTVSDEWRHRFTEDMSRQITA
jgi:LPS sulfotransferase NodH